MSDCLFCKIVAGEIPCHKIWEDEKHLAFLTIFPNTEGFSVVIPKKHYSSYVFELPEAVMQELMIAAKHVAAIIDAAFSDVGRTGLMFEGFGVDHVHAKLFPMHGTKSDEWKQNETTLHTYFDTYQGYMSSHNGPRAADESLAKTAAKIRGEV